MFIADSAGDRILKFRSTFGKVMGKSGVCCFLNYRVVSVNLCCTVYAALSICFYLFIIFVTL